MSRTDEQGSYLETRTSRSVIRDRCLRTASSAHLSGHSNVSGVLGHGAALPHAGARTHLITGECEDNGGLSSFTQVTITVTPQPAAASTAPAGSAMLERARILRCDGFHRRSSRERRGGSIVDVYRNGSRIATPANSGAWTDAINQRGSGSYTYKVCNAGTSTCSSDVTITF
jgi:hypothetical protein